MNAVAQSLDCLTDSDAAALPLLVARPDTVQAVLASLPPPQAAFARANGFTGAAQELVLLPGPDGLAGAIIGLGADRSPNAFGGLPFRMPEGTTWKLAPGDYDLQAAVLGFCLGAYGFNRLKPARRAPARLVAAAGQAGACAQAMWMVRDLINLPANFLGPMELAGNATELAGMFGAKAQLVTGADLAREYPMIAAVGAGSERAPVVARLEWRGSGAAADAPLVSLCGKGVVFDTGGYDLKPSAGMLRMKKDMGGAAVVLGIARMIMQADLPIRLNVRIGCVENSVSGHAMRPLDVVRTRAGLTVEVGNTDAEGRLVLCDLLADAAAEKPDLLVDCATLTGAARVALGPDLPALFCNDDSWADALLHASRDAHDPMWRLPLWSGYDPWLQSPVADLNNVSTKPFGGAIIGALFLQRFVTPPLSWAHIDLYAWNDQTTPGRPEGGEAQALRAVFTAIATRFGNRPGN
jgi:leucyl aminopeptidase